MKIIYKYILTILTLLPLIGCHNISNKTSNHIDNKSYISNFELIQENPQNDTRVRITSPQAIIDPTNNNIDISKSLIEILNKKGTDFQVKSGNSSLNNLSNLIKVYNNVNISFIDNENHYINTSSFTWDLNQSNIELESPLDINFNNTKIIGTNGYYNIETRQLQINNNLFNRNIYNSNGVMQYQLEIKSDFAKWIKDNNTLVFTSDDKQIETTIKFLSVK